MVISRLNIRQAISWSVLVAIAAFPLLQGGCSPSEPPPSMPVPYDDQPNSYPAPPNEKAPEASPSPGASPSQTPGRESRVPSSPRDSSAAAQVAANDSSTKTAWVRPGDSSASSESGQQQQASSSSDASETTQQEQAAQDEAAHDQGAASSVTTRDMQQEPKEKQPQDATESTGQAASADKATEPADTDATTSAETDKPETDGDLPPDSSTVAQRKNGTDTNGTATNGSDGQSQQRTRETAASSSGPESGEASQQSSAAAGADQLRRLGTAFRDVAQRIKPSVVQVAAEVRPGSVRRQWSEQLSQRELDALRRKFGPLMEQAPELSQFFRGRRFEQQDPQYQQYNVPLPLGSASGWIYDDRGHVVTNHHVVSRADEITLTFLDDTTADAELVGSDPQTDVAVLRTKKKGIAPAKLATRSVQQGDLVLAVGAPMQYAFSLSQGIVSATGRQTGILGPQGYENFIQTDAAINPGNSGGPLVNTQGEVVGMSTAIASRSGSFAGIGFAIPSRMIRDVVEELIRKGKIERGYLGVVISDREELLATFGVDDGVLIDSVVAGGPADQSGLQPGDVIVSLDGESVGQANALRQTIARTDPGEAIELVAVRDGERRQLDVTLEQQPTEQPERSQPRRPRPAENNMMDQTTPLGKLGFERLRPITQDIVEQYDLNPNWGVLVLQVRPYSAVAAAGIARGHIITQVYGARVENVEQLRREINKHDVSEGVRLRVAVPGGPGRFLLLTLEP